MPERLVREQTIELRRTLVTGGGFQGMPDIEKQTHLEANGVQTMFALDQLAQARAGNGAAGATARQVARGILESMLGRPPDSAMLATIARGELPLPMSVRCSCVATTTLSAMMWS